jgi:hypothetical protein
MPKAVPQDAQTDAQVSELRTQLAQMREQLTDMREQRNAWQGIAERLALGGPKIASQLSPAADVGRRLSADFDAKVVFHR